MLGSCVPRTALCTCEIRTSTARRAAPSPPSLYTFSGREGRDPRGCSGPLVDATSSHAWSRVARASSCLLSSSSRVPRLANDCAASADQPRPSATRSATDRSIWARALAPAARLRRAPRLLGERRTANVPTAEAVERLGDEPRPPRALTLTQRVEEVALDLCERPPPPPPPPTARRPRRRRRPPRRSIGSTPPGSPRAPNRRC